MGRIWQTMLDEPLIPFSVIGGVLFVVYGFRKQVDSIETIEIRPTTVRALETMQQDLLGRPLNEQERQDIVESFIDDEILMREAFRMELEKKDSRVRKRLLNIMRSTLDQPVAQPTTAELQAYYRENQDQFLPEEVITFDHVYFSYDSENEVANTDEFLANLRDDANHLQFGDNQLFGNIMRDVSKRQLRQMLGAEFAEQAFSLLLNEWQGPIESRQGVHFLRVTEKREPPPPSFEGIKDYLRQEWIFRKRREIQNEKIAEIRKRYRVVHVQEQ